ncbi:MAG: tetratricopeptide repeat protein, partial [Desulfobacula sp.]|nr:tetratricopeptide repeat protein [Desulfobacula sp.]
MKAPVKNIIFKGFFLFFCSFFLFSCSTFDFFKKEADPVEQESLVHPNTGDENAALEQEGLDNEVLKTELDNRTRNISVLEDKILLLEKKVSGLESQLATQKPVIYQVAYTEPSQLYQKARSLLLEGDVSNAAQLFKTFVEQHPKHNLADNAMYWLGECHYSSGQYAKAVAVFKDLVKAYPKAEKVP